MDKKFFKPELWGGIECTINRVGDRFFDQLNYSGHYIRHGDIPLIAELGMKRLRYPILWERHQPVQAERPNFTLTALKLDQIREAGIEPIAGLLHHGSGPAYTDLLDEKFGEKLADYALSVAKQFPWIKYWTPVNEPLTTARFSGLYGFWYPHHSTDESFFKMLVNEIRGTIMAMEKIRSVNPEAELIQTEDLGKTYATPLLSYQAEFENERRWLTYDLVCGKVNEQHPLFKYLLKKGVTQEDLAFFEEHALPPQVAGFNHYLTSERYLDDKLEHYPSHVHGTNGRHKYADVEAVRVNLSEETGIRTLLQEAWDRYRIPLAVTEVHLHCHREHQLRWFRHVWESCCALNSSGVEVQGVTSWALFGSHGWSELLQNCPGVYEPGAFDLRNGEPRATRLVSFLKTVTQTQECSSPLIDAKGWWEDDHRILYGDKPNPVKTFYSDTRDPILIIGKNGTLGRAMSRICTERNITHVTVGSAECDVRNRASIQKWIDEVKPSAIINTAGYVRVDDAENEYDECMRLNADAVEHLATLCQQHSIHLTSFSSDLVFDGMKNGYTESDSPSPLNVYGKSKAAAEEIMRRICPTALMIRTSAFFGPWDVYNFAHAVRNSLNTGELFMAVNDYIISPTYVPDLAHATLDLSIDMEAGIWHLCNGEAVSWYQFACRIVEAFGLPEQNIIATELAQMKYAASRPRNSVLLTQRGQHLPSLQSAIERYAKEVVQGIRKVA